jgi:hypothetical protein
VFEDGLRKAADTVNFLTSELGKLDEDLDTLDQLADIEEQFAKIAEGTDDIEDQQREVRRLTGMIADYVGTLDNIPTEKVSEIVAVLRSGDVERMRALLDDLTKDRFINIGITPAKQSAFESLNGRFSAGAAPSAPIYTGVQSAIPSGYVDNRNITVINPIGSTPTTQYIDGVTDARRNGTRS